MGHVRACATENAVTLFWDKPERGEAYTILMDGRVLGEADKTHFTAEGLECDTAYRFEVVAGGMPIGRCEARTLRRKNRIDVRKYGAAGDGRTVDTAALQRAIDACGPDDELYLSPGTYLTGALRLHGGMSVYLELGAVLQGTDRPEDYLPKIPSRFEGTEMMCYSSLLNLGELDHGAGANCSDVLIYGKGTIASGGQALGMRVIEAERARLADYMAQNKELVDSCENESTIPGRARPRLINMSNCSNVRITGLTLKDGASWNVHMIYSDHIVTDHCAFYSDGVWNGDGWDPDSSEDCALFACEFYTEDDCVAIKSGKNPEGNVIGRPCRHIRVFDCKCVFGHGICIGSEISGGIEDVGIWDCDLANSSNGIEVKGTKKRGGYVRNVRAWDSVLPRLMIHTVGYNDDGIAAEHPPVFEGFDFRRLEITGRALEGREWRDEAPLQLAGFDEDGYHLRDVELRDCVFFGGCRGASLQNCAGVTLANITCG